MNHRGDVPIDITCRHGSVSERMEDYARKKAERLPRFNDQISRIEIVVDGPHEAPEIEVVVHIDNHEHVVASEKAEHFNAAIDGAVGKIERQLVKLKEKLKLHKGDSNPKG
jgi:putative sigma-54 modulation protein